MSPMQITETITRECCGPTDMRPVMGSPRFESEDAAEYQFCRYCGHWQRLTDKRDAHGNLYATYEPVALPWRGHD